MAPPLIPTAAAIALLLTAVYKYLIYPAFVSPLARVPNAHWSAPFSPLWILYQRHQRQDTPAVHAAHARKGSLIRLGPRELSINAVDGGIRTIYAGGFGKGAWYSRVFANYGGVAPMFAMERNDAHSARKRMLSNVYAKTTLHTNAGLARAADVIVHERLVPWLRREVDAGRAVEIYDVFSSVVMDFVAAYAFGLKQGSDWVRQPEAAAAFFRAYKAQQRYTFWPQELPTLTNLAFRLGVGWLLVPGWVAKVNKQVEDMIAEMCDRAEMTLSSSTLAHNQPLEDYPTVYAQLRGALLKAGRKASPAASDAELVAAHRLDLASELLDHTIAGFDTSGITLTWLAWELSKSGNRGWQTRLQEELRPLKGSLDARTLDGLPVLHAVLMESLRLHAAIPGNQPRITPAGAVLGDPATGVCVAGVPAGVRVQAQAWSLHRNPDVFPHPDRWDPSRWLEADEGRKREMARWFWAFGSGGRMCVGSNLAMLDMKATMAGLWVNFTTEIAFDFGMVHNGGYIAEPLGVGPDGGTGTEDEKRYLTLRLSALEDR